MPRYMEKIPFHRGIYCVLSLQFYCKWGKLIEYWDSLVLFRMRKYMAAVSCRSCRIEILGEES